MLLSVQPDNHTSKKDISLLYIITKMWQLWQGVSSTKKSVQQEKEPVLPAIRKNIIKLYMAAPSAKEVPRNCQKYISTIVLDFSISKKRIAGRQKS